MLQNLSNDIRDCYRNADECRQLAHLAFNETERTDFLGIERRWLYLASSYELIEQLISPK
jgi:hypothetical protein